MLRLTTVPSQQVTLDLEWSLNKESYKEFYFLFYFTFKKNKQNKLRFQIFLNNFFLQ